MNKESLDPYCVVRISNMRELTPNQLYLHMWLWSKWSDKNTYECFPSHKTISNDIGWSVTTVKRVLYELIDKGFIEVVEQFREDGSQTTNTYVLLNLNDSFDGESVKSDTPPVQNWTTPPVQNWTTPQSESGLPRINNQLTKNQIEPLLNMCDDDEATNECEKSAGLYLEETCELTTEEILVYYFVERHNAYKASIGSTQKASVSVKNIKDMKLFLKHGGLKDGVSTEPPSPETIRKYIDWLFEGAGTETRNGFCWANVIGSVAKLRTQWVPIEGMLYRQKKQDEPTAEWLHLQAIIRGEA